MARAISSTSPPCWATRRLARTSGEATRYTFSVASGNTTEPMSLPSTTPPPWSAIHLRCRVRISSRTAELAATWLTAASTSGERIAAVASTPLTCRLSRVCTNCTDRATRATASTSAASRPRFNTSNVTPRYIAPVSRYSMPRSAANALAIVDLPAPAGPSMATTTAVITNWCRSGDPRRSPTRSARPPWLARGSR